MGVTLSEHESKRMLAEFGIPVPDERLAHTLDQAVEEAEALGYPVVVKLCGRGLAHKTERRLVRLGLISDGGVSASARELLALRTAPDQTLLVGRMVQGRREVIAGMIRDPVFGPCVMLGLGGIFAEALGDVAFAVAPVTLQEAIDLVDALRYGHVLGEFRGEPAVDRTALGAVLVSLGRMGVERPDVLSVDVNPLILAGSHPVVVDALVEMDASA